MTGRDADTPPCVTVEVEVTPRISYAMAHNRTPVVSRLTLKSSTDLLGAVVRIAVDDAEGTLSAPFSGTIDLAARSATGLRDVQMRLDPAAMLQVTDRRPGRILIEVSHDDVTVGRAEAPVEVLAARQWLNGPGLLPLEMLAAHVMPNDPAVADVLSEAAALLEQRTGSPSLQGYQSGEERVDAIVEAVWDAVRARRVRYSEPPASWGEQGQKIRTPGEVLDGRVGTCLDTTVVLAALLEQAGVRPLLWLVEGHAFLGYWRHEKALDAIAQREVEDVVNLVDLGAIRLVETTMVAAGEQDLPFAVTGRSPYDSFLSGDLSRVIGVTDVWTARRNDIVPLPARRTTAEGGVQVVEYRAAEHSSAPVPRTRPAPACQGDARAPAVPGRVQQWKNALLDLSLRNRLINYRDSAGVPLTVPPGRLGVVEDTLHQGHGLNLLPADQIADVHRERGLRSGADLPAPQLDAELLTRHAVFTAIPGAGYASRMRGLAYKARTIIEETGANNLYLALGSLVWAFDGKPLRSPLILVPVRLVTRSRALVYRLELDEAGGSTPNYCLLEKLRQVHGLEVPGLAEPEDDGAGIDLDAALDAMRVAVAEKGLPYRVEATADLSILQFAKFRLWKDLDEHWEELAGNPLVHHLIDTPTEPFVDPVPEPAAATDLDELDASCPVPADASQLAAVAEAVAGRTFVLEGPPGTGKSQTITNLLTRAVADGKRVLFVAEKRAALDVVRGRLDSVGMGAFSLDLHDKGSKPAAVRAQVRAALDHAVGVDGQGHAAELEELRSSRRALARYAQRLHEPNGADLSFYSARTSLLALGDDGEALPVPASLLAARDERVRTVRRVMATLPDVADLARPAPDHPWGFTRDLGPAASVAAAAITAAAREVDDSLRALAASPEAGSNPRFAAVLRAARSVDDLTALGALAGVSVVTLNVLDEARTPEWSTATTALRHEVSAFVAAAHPGLDVATPAALDLPLADLHAQAQAAAASGWWGRSKRLKAVLARLQPALRPDASVAPKHVPELVGALLQVQGAVRQLAARASSVPGLVVPETWDPFTDQGRTLVDRQVEWLAWAGAAVDSSRHGSARQRFLSALRDFLDGGEHVSPGTAESVKRAAAALERVTEVTGSSPGELVRWAGDAGLLDRWQATAARRGLEDDACLPLRRWAALLEHLAPLGPVGMSEASRLLLEGEISSDDAVRAFDRGLALASMVERRAATGLDAFDAKAHDRAISRFTASSAAVRDQLRTSVPAEVVARRPFDASTGRGQVGALQRELARQRGGLGVRRLLATYGELITQLMPCVLVSPDSLSRFFPVGGTTFDLVVFDEASQIRVADAVGAMGRSRAVVVVGDSKQMPPSTFAEPSAGDDEAEESVVVQDEESILSECVLARVPQRWLSWHYRSQDESLIAFSNGYYYDGKLSSFPAPRTGGADRGVTGHGISLVPVDGHFHRTGKGKRLRTNPREAEEVVAEIRRRFDASPDTVPSIGVVTFNQQQRALVEATLRDAGDDRLVEALDAEDEGLFVKNLENVQGDERDVILFSTAFSPNDKGVLPLNFGPLNRGGGERRLNVAVTRARRQVVVFSSFAPQLLRAEETSSVGIKHLRAYLDLAAQGTSALPPAAVPKAGPDRHRGELAAALRRRGLLVVEDLGLSDFKVDLAVGAGGAAEPSVAVLLDGPGWASRRTVGDRDGLPVQVLGRLMRWPAVERVWLPEWLADAEAVLTRLEAATSRVGDTDAGHDAATRASAVPAGATAATPFAAFAASAATSPAAAPSVTVSVTAGLRDAGRLPGEEAFRAWRVSSVGGRGVLDALPAPHAAETVRRVIEEVVDAEGPVHPDRLAKQVAGAFGLTRVSGGRAAAIVDQVPDHLLRDDEGFVWPPQRSPRSWQGFRAARDEPRPVEHVSSREIGNAMVALCSTAAGMERAELLREALGVFGGRRLTAGITARMQGVLDAALGSGRLRTDGQVVTAGRAHG